MLGDFLTRCLILALGYAYPAFECYKIVEKNKIEIEELRFWCQYWILVACLTVLERIGDVFISWLPLYGAAKVALFIYLWCPKTKGTGYIFDTLLKPYMAKHESDIDAKLKELRLRIWDLVIFYWQNCAHLIQTAILQVFKFMASQSVKAANSGPSEGPRQQAAAEAPSTVAPIDPSALRKRQAPNAAVKHQQQDQ